MKAENIFKVTISDWSTPFSVKCGDTSREFNKPHYPTMGFLVGFGMWLKANDWAVDVAFKDCNEKTVADEMLKYVTQSMEQKRAFCEHPACEVCHVEINDETCVENDNVYYQVLNGIAQRASNRVFKYVAVNPNEVWEALVREELKRNTTI